MEGGQQLSRKLPCQGKNMYTRTTIPDHYGQQLRRPGRNPEQAFRGYGKTA